MWSDEIDNKMKEAAESNHPAYDDKAWDKMEVLLDKHLPVKKKRRRFILLWLPLLLVGTGIFFMLQKPVRKGISVEKNTAIQSKYISKMPAQGTAIPIPSKTTTSKQAAIPLQQDKITPAPGENKSPKIKLQKQSVSGKTNIDNSKKVKQIISQEQQFKQEEDLREKKYSRKTREQENNFPYQKPVQQNTLVAAIDKSSVNNTVTPVFLDTSVSVTQKTIAAEEIKQPDSSETKEAIIKANPQKQKTSAASKLSLNISFGPDISSVGFDNPGQWNLQYGIGFSYALSKQVSIRTGFFVGRKKYSADSTEYHSAYYPPRLERIDANCLVYEIPVNLIYNFPAAKKHNWFIAGGLSSYLMKEETYEYYYKNAWGQPQYYSHTYKNANSHIFSVINISGGYQYHFTDRLSLLAEPYVKIPVSGIGSGKVQLNSVGILFSIGFKPFLKKK